MSSEYVSQDEIDAALQNIFKDKRSRLEAIRDRAKAAIGVADKLREMAIEAALKALKVKKAHVKTVNGMNRLDYARMRGAIKAAEEANSVAIGKAIQAAEEALDRAVEAAEVKADQEVVAAEAASESQLAAMQRDFERLLLLRQVYHDAPNDVFELIFSKCNVATESGFSFSFWGRLNALRGLNALRHAFRLANKRCRAVVESCTTRLTNLHQNGPTFLPILQRCNRIAEMRCHSHNLRSLEGCPAGLKVLAIGNAPHLSVLSPLASCLMMQELSITNSSITDISVVSSMPLLMRFACRKKEGRPSIKDLSPLSSCTRLRVLEIDGNRELKDLSPLSACAALEVLKIASCSLITSLAPLSDLKCLKELSCRGIDPQTSLLSLVSCTGLKSLKCFNDAVGLKDLRRRRPDIAIHLIYDPFE